MYCEIWKKSIILEMSAVLYFTFLEIKVNKFYKKLQANMSRYKYTNLYIAYFNEIQSVTENKNIDFTV